MLDGLDGDALAALPGDHQHRHGMPARGHLLQGVDAGAIRKHVIQQHQVVLVARQARPQVVQVIHMVQLGIAGQLQEFLFHLGLAQVVIHDQDAVRRVGAGSLRSVKIERIQSQRFPPLRYR